MKWTIRKTMRNQSGSCSAYLIERHAPKGRSIASNYRFGKVAVGEATAVSLDRAQSVIRSLRRIDGSGCYSLIAI